MLTNREKNNTNTKTKNFSRNKKTSDYHSILSIQQPELFQKTDSIFKSIFPDLLIPKKRDRERFQKAIDEKKQANESRYKSNRRNGRHGAKETPYTILAKLRKDCSERYSPTQLSTLMEKNDYIAEFFALFPPSRLLELYGESLIFVIATNYSSLSYENRIATPLREEFYKLPFINRTVEKYYDRDYYEKGRRCVQLAGGNYHSFEALKAIHMFHHRGNKFDQVNFNFQQYIKSTKILESDLSIEFVRTEKQDGKGFAEGYQPKKINNKEIDLYLDNSLGIVVYYKNMPIAVLAGGLHDFETFRIEQMQKVAYDQWSVHGYLKNISYLPESSDIDRQNLLYDHLKTTLLQFGFSKLQIQSGENNFWCNHKYEFRLENRSYLEGKIDYPGRSIHIYPQEGSVHLTPEIAEKVYDDFAKSKGYHKIKYGNREKTIIPAKVLNKLKNS